jgi:hypothetical protein
MECCNDPLTPDLQCKVELSDIWSATLGNRWFSPAFSPKQFAHLPDDLTCVYAVIT